ncbi:MAG: DUF5684 domain-containing protein [Rikenellaceae bacterium]
MSSLLIAIIVLLPIIALWVIFTKAGRPGWAAIIPIYNALVMLRVAGKPGWWIFLFLIPIVNVIFLIMTLNGISKNFGKGVGFTVGLLFLPFIFFLILAFGPAQYAPKAIEA